MSWVMTTEVTQRSRFRLVDQVVDRIGPDRIDAGGGFVVEHDFRASWRWPGPAPRVSACRRKAPRVFYVSTSTEPKHAGQHVRHLAGDFVLGHLFPAEAEGDIVVDVHGIEERSSWKSMPNFRRDPLELLPPRGA